MTSFLLIYSIFVTVFVTASGLGAAKTSTDYALQVIFLPVTLSLILTLIRKTSGKLLAYYSFIVTSLFTFSGFAASRNYYDLALAYIFTPVFAYFFSLVLPKRKHAIVITPQPVDTAKMDRDRRAFIKLIGTAGTALFLFSVFGIKKAEAAFFGSVPGPGTVSLKDSLGAKIDPAEKHPTDGYRITELDDAGAYTYAGYLYKTGAWFILRDDETSYRYAKGSSNFTTNWTNRASLTYDYYDNVF